MNGRLSLTPGADQDLRRLAMLWHAVLPGGIVVVAAALYGLVHYGGYQPPAIGTLAGILPGALAGILFFGMAAAMLLKRRLPHMVTRNPDLPPVQRVTGAMFTLLGIADAPAIFAIAFYMMMPSDELALAIVAYAFIAAFVFKPDFAQLLAAAKGRN